jgi:hypothetical protein
VQPAPSTSIRQHGEAGVVEAGVVEAGVVEVAGG